MTALHLPDGVSLVVEHDLLAVAVETPACAALIHPHGAQVVGWRPTGHQPVLWLSKHSTFEAGAAIRGGIPICFPWFGAGPDGTLSPSHGFARLADWRLVGADRVGDDVTLTFELTRAGVGGLPGAEHLPTDARCRYAVRLGSDLDVALTVEAGETGFTSEQALHTYLAVHEVTEVVVRGLDRAAYHDKVHDRDDVQRGEVRFDGEVDRVYANSGPVVVDDPLLGRRIHLGSEGAANTVVWHPGVEKAAALPDIGDGGWLGFVCVEAANVGRHAVRLEPGASHTVSQRIHVESDLLEWG